MLQVGRSGFRLQMRPLDFFNLPDPSSRSMALGFTQPLIEPGIFLGEKCGWHIRLKTSPPSVGPLSRAVVFNLYLFADPKT
jgi:hypothetical protein